MSCSVELVEHEYSHGVTRTTICKAIDNRCKRYCMDNFQLQKTHANIFAETFNENFG